MSPRSSKGLGPVITACLALVGGTLPILSAVAGIAPVAPARAQVTGYPTTPPAPICGNTSLLTGPATAPPGAITVLPSQVNALYDLSVSNGPNTTFWLAPGTHRFSDDQYAQVIPRDGNTYIGAPGAILDGRGVNKYAFGQFAMNVTIRYITIQNFISPNDEAVVNHESATGWLVEHNTIKNNHGAGLGIGDNSVTRHNCITNNGQYGFTANKVGGNVNIVMDHNEISFNDADDIELNQPHCGCSGGGKFYGTRGAVVTDNWIHHNKAQGLFADTNAVGFRIEGNYLNDNMSEAIVYETSYNALIKNNTLIRNTLRKGRIFAARGETFPATAIYIQEGGGDARVFGGVYANLEVTGNYLEDNWGGIEVWENANRFCNTAGSTAPGFCPLAGAATVSTCVPPSIYNAPYIDDCRWKAQNVLVHHNIFDIDRVALDCVGGPCGEQGLFSNWGDSPPWSPYLGPVVQDDVTFNQNNRWYSNTYLGTWAFDVYSIGNIVDWNTWCNAPYSQDVGSTLNGAGCGAVPSTTTTAPTTTVAPTTTTSTTVAPTTTTSTTVPGAVNALDNDTSTIEGSTGRWAAWFSSTIARTTAQAHGGTHSLQVNITNPWGWGVTLNNWPGFNAIPGNKTISFWARSPNSGLSATMQVTFRNTAGTVLGTQLLTRTLTNAWQQATAVVTAPAGTTKVLVDFLNTAGGAGDVIFLDDIVVANGGVPSTTTTAAPTTTVAPTTTTTPVGVNALDTNTAGIESSVGHWVAWFSSTIARTTAQAHTGTASLQVNVTNPWGWGVTLNNWPGFNTVPGNKTIGFWARSPGTGLAVTMQVTFRNTAGTVLGTQLLTRTVNNTWQQASANVTAPAGTTKVLVDFYNTAGGPGDVVFLDDIRVANA